jgi:hypothetical protein
VTDQHIILDLQGEDEEPDYYEETGGNGGSTPSSSTSPAWTATITRSPGATMCALPQRSNRVAPQADRF